MSTSDLRPLPTLVQLWKATGIAIVIALAILIAAVLPAEYGIDPTGIGGKLGLGKLASASLDTPSARTAAGAAPTQETPTVVAPLAPIQAVLQRKLPFRSNEMALTLKPGEGAEIKAAMRTGDHFVFSWDVENGKVNFDMHGEPPNAGNDDFTSYWKGREHSEGHGIFTAPFDGTHGWFWRNRGSAPVTVRVKVSGFYEKLYRP